MQMTKEEAGIYFLRNVITGIKDAQGQEVDVGDVDLIEEAELLITAIAAGMPKGKSGQPKPN